MSRRISELDSIRGLAALSVVLCQILNIFPPLPKILSYTPIRIFWEAVVLFFVLSGFVLSIPFIRTTNFSYTGFLIK